MTQASRASPDATLRVATWFPGWRARGVIIALGAVVAAAAALTYGLQSPHRNDQFAQALQAIEQGDLPAARAIAHELNSSPARKPEATLLQGAILLKKGFYYPAIDVLDTLDGNPALRNRSLTLTGEAWYHLGRHVECQAALKKVLQHDADFLDAHRWLAASYYDLGAIHDALVHLKKVADLDPADHRPHRLLGLIYKDYERYPDAVPCYIESLRRKPDQPDWIDVRQELAACQLKLRLHRDALETLASCPNAAEVDVVRAESHYALGQGELAQQALARASAEQPDNLDVLMLRGTVMLEEGNVERATELFIRATEKYPMDYLAHLKLSQALAQSQKPKQAEAEQQLAERIRKTRLEFAELHRVAWDNPGDANVRLRLAMLAQELQRPDLADVWMKSAAALAPMRQTRLERSATSNAKAQAD